MNADSLKKCIAYFVMVISGILIGILLIPTGILLLSIYLIWETADKVIYWLEVKKTNYEKWHFHDVSPIYLQLAHKLQYAILSGEICSGENIPTIREMSGTLHINSNTILKSYGIVKQNRLVIRTGNGRYTVTQDKAYIQAEKDKTIKELYCNYFSKMFELGFTKSEAVVFMQDFCENLTCHE